MQDILTESQLFKFQTADVINYFILMCFIPLLPKHKGKILDGQGHSFYISHDKDRKTRR